METVQERGEEIIQQVRQVYEQEADRTQTLRVLHPGCLGHGRGDYTYELHRVVSTNNLHTE